MASGRAPESIFGSGAVSLEIDEATAKGLALPGVAGNVAVPGAVENKHIIKKSGLMPRVRQEQKDHDIFLTHPARNLDEVVNDITAIHPEDTFCFLNVKKLSERAAELRDHFLPNNSLGVVAYAVKANAKDKILRVLGSEGIDHYDCASANEIAQVKSCQPNAEILYNHPIKTPADIAEAASMGVAHFTVQSQREIDKLSKVAQPYMTDRKMEVAVRLSTPNDNAAINLSTKFGASEPDLRAMIRYIRDVVGALPGISIHTGSQNQDPEVYTTAIKKISLIGAEEGGMNTMNVGGGIPVNYHDKDQFDLRTYLDIINRAIVEYGRHTMRGDNPKILLEVGRSMVAECIDLVIPVLAVEDRNRGRCAYINDGVYTSFSDFAVHEWPYNFLWRGKDGRKLSDKMVPFEVFGRTCDSGDSLGQIVLPEDLGEGDYLWVKNAGAYMDAQGGRFNGFDLPKYVAYNT